MSNSSKIRAVFYSIVPSPYQRDLFYALSQLPQLDIQVFYLEKSVADSPWPEKDLQSYEKVLNGFFVGWGSSRFHINWHIPDIKNADIIVLNGYQSSIAQWILRFSSRQTPIVFWGERMLVSAQGIKKKIQKILANSLNKCVAIAAIGKEAEIDYAKRYPQQLIVPIPYYCELRNFQHDIPQRPRNPITILFCGQMIVRKGVDLLLAAFTRLVENDFPVRLLLIGREAELPDMMADLPSTVQESIEYAGFQSPDDLPQFFLRSDIFVLPSRYDGWGVVVNQALGAGLPIICSDAVGSAPDLVEWQKNGFIFPAGDMNKLYEALDFYISNPDRIRTASEVSFKRSFDWFPEVGAQRWLALMDKILA